MARASRVGCLSSDQIQYGHLNHGSFLPYVPSQLVHHRFGNTPSTEPKKKNVTPSHTVANWAKKCIVKPRRSQLSQEMYCWATPKPTESRNVSLSITIVHCAKKCNVEPCRCPLSQEMYRWATLLPTEPRKVSLSHTVKPTELRNVLLSHNVAHWAKKCMA